ncbi:MAG: hypothetical protein NW205_07545 [Hyphomicrobiaceae bacterium]|nr:hypothetical protein [Hyphomicrobiaceae bacterium]
MATVPGLAQTAAEPATAVVVFDASGSMWGELPGGRGPKFEVAREALRRSFGTTPPGRSGLVVFGRTCAAAEVAVAAGAQPVDALLQPLDRLNPRGKGPLVQGLRQAAGAFGPGDRGGVVIVHDGNDNCGEDICKAAREFAAAIPGVPVSLVSLGVPAPEKIATRCAAEITGGKVFTAETQAEIGPAVEAAVRLALLGGRPPAPIAAQPRDAAQRGPQAGAGNEPQRPADGPPHLVVRAFLGDGQVPMTQPLRWRLYRASDLVKPMLDIVEPRFELPLAPGAYVVDAAAGLVAGRRDIVVAERGPTLVDLRLDAGSLALGREADSKGAGLPATVTVSRLTGGRAEPVVISPTLAASLVLPAGRYRVDAERGSTRLSREIDVAAGQHVDAGLELATGTLRLGVVARGGQRVEEALVVVATDDPAAAGGRREIARAAAGEATFALPAGTYYLSATAGAAQSSDQIAIGAGQAVEHTMVLDTGSVTVEAVATLGGQVVRLPARVLVSAAARPDVVIASSPIAKATFRLAPGTYRVRAEIGARNVTATRDVTVDAGTALTLPVEAKAAELRLVLASAGAISYAERYWEVRDAGGAVVWRSSHPTPAAVLAPGRYVVSCETGGRSLEKAIELVAGRRETVEFER